MKIRLITQNPFIVGFGGLEYQAQTYIRGIQALDSSVDIDFLKRDEKDIDILHIVGVHSALNPYILEVLKKKSKKIIISTVFYLKPSGIFDYRRPVLYKAFGYIPFHVTNFMKKNVNMADCLLPNSISESKQLQKVFGVSGQKIHVLHNGVDENFFEGISNTLFKKKFNIENYILSVSHIEPRKNQTRLIEAFIDFKNANMGRYGNLKIVLLGNFRGNYFKYHKKIKYYLKKYQHEIIHIKNLKNNDPLFKSAYLGASMHILPSSLETPGLSSLEAGLGGCPIVVGDCPPVREYFHNHGIYVHGNNTKSIYNGIESALSNAHAHQKKEQIAYIKGRFTRNKICKQLLTLYKS